MSRVVSIISWYLTKSVCRSLSGEINTVSNSTWKLPTTHKHKNNENRLPEWTHCMYASYLLAIQIEFCFISRPLDQWHNCIVYSINSAKEHLSLSLSYRSVSNGCTYIISIHMRVVIFCVNLLILITTEQQMQSGPKVYRQWPFL